MTIRKHLYTLLDGEKLAAVLDRHRPGWALEWADQDDLLALARGNIRVGELKYRVGNKLFHPILHAAMEAGLIEEAKNV